jgi:ubiquitin carboxyl-terminal hydrolase 25
VLTFLRLFYGNFIWKYLNTEAEDNDEAFSAINISLTEKPKDINAGLDGAFAIDEVTLNGNRTKRFRTITKLPPIFQIYLQRQDFDHDRQDTVINKHHIQLDEVIYLDRFMTLANTELQSLRQKSWKLDSRLSKLKSKRTALQSTTTPGIDGPDLLDATYQFVSSHAEEISADAAILERLQADAAARRADLESLATTIESVDDDKARLFAEHQQHAYRLAAVFVHRGQGGARGGHYWVYVCDFASGVWRRYEDREVREVVDRSEIFGEADPEVQGAPYFCVYVQDDRKESIVDAVFRVKPESPVDSDAQMDGVVVERIESSSGSGSGGVAMLETVPETVPENRSVMEMEMN